MDPALQELLAAGGPPDAEEVEAIMRLDRPDSGIPGVRIVSRFGSIATCRLRRDALLSTRAQEEVLSLKAGRVLRPEREPPQTGDAVGLPDAPVDSDVRRPAGLSLDGSGVCIGIADWGCDFDYPSFKHPDGSTRLVALWDQRGPPQPGQPNRYGYGTCHSALQINRALRNVDPYAALGYHPADADQGGGMHGTHVMDIAAGNGLGGGPAGVAPRTDLIFVHLANRGTGGLATLGDSVRILEAVDFIARVAGPRPWVVNLSMGNHGGPHDGLTLVEIALDLMLNTAPGRFVTQSSGNYFDKRTAASGRLQRGQVRLLRMLVDAADITPNELEVWYNGNDAFAVRTESPTGATSPWVQLGAQATILQDDKVVGRIYNRASDPNNADNHVDVFLYPDAVPGQWTVALRADNADSGAFHAWIERDDAFPGCQTHFSELDADSHYTTGTLGNSRLPLIVGAYDAHSSARDVAPFSSAGPTRDERPKPDLVAPGVDVLAARSTPRGHPRNTGLLTRKSGTSMAAPHVAGTVALCLQGARRALWGREIRDIVLGNVEAVDGARERALRFGRGYLDVARVVQAVTVAPARRARPLAPALSPSRQDNASFQETPMEPDMAEQLDRFAQIAKESTCRAASERALFAQVLPRSSLDPEAIYGAVVSGRSGPAAAMIDESFTVLARPGEAPARLPQAGDILLRVALGEPGLGHVAVLSDSTLWPAAQPAEPAFRSEDTQPGFYATVVEGGAFPHTREDRFARRILDPRGRMPPGQLLLARRLSPKDRGPDRVPAEETVAGGDAYEKLHRLLSYGLTDWAVTDTEALEVLNTLASLSDEELVETYYRLWIERLWDRFVDNLPTGREHPEFHHLSDRIDGLLARREITPAEEKLIREVCEHFYPGKPPLCVNRELVEVVIDMFRRAVRDGSKAMDFVPQPFLGLPRPHFLRWLLMKGARQFLDGARRGGRAHEACRKAVACWFRSKYEVAQIPCH